MRNLIKDNMAIGVCLSYNHMIIIMSEQDTELSLVKIQLLSKALLHSK